MNKKTNILRKILALIVKGGVVLGTTIIFYKIPSLIAEKISYEQLKRKQFS